MKPPVAPRPASRWALTAIADRLRGVRTARSGSITAEFALVIPLLLLLLFSIIEFGRVMWIRSAMQSAVESAARCYALNQPDCDTVEKVKTYAVAASAKVPVTTASFTPAPAACGKQVSATYSFTPIVPLIPLNVTLSARACRPAPP